MLIGSKIILRTQKLSIEYHSKLSLNREIWMSNNINLVNMSKKQDHVSMVQLA